MILWIFLFLLSFGIFRGNRFDFHFFRFALINTYRADSRGRFRWLRPFGWFLGKSNCGENKNPQEENNGKNLFHFTLHTE